MIGKMAPDGTIKAIRCMHDGYPEGVGALLKSNYWEEEEVDALLGIGDISSLGSSPYQTKTYEALSIEYGEGAYPAKGYGDDLEMLEASHNEFLDYCYLLCDGEWLVDDGYGFHPY